MTTDTEQLHRDLFPADVTLDGALLQREARVFVTGTEVLVYAVSPERECVQVARLALISDPPQRIRGAGFVGHLSFITEAGPIDLNRAKGCGCQSPLKVMTPPVAW